MKTATLALLLGTALLAVGLACSDDGEPELTLAEYLQRFEVTVQRGCANIDALRIEALQTPTMEHLSDEERVAQTRTVLESAQAVSRSVVAELSELEPPNIVRQAHNEYADALDEQDELFEAWLESDRFPAYILALDAADSIDDLLAIDDLTVGSEFTSAEESQQGARRQLGSIAADHGIEFGTSCEPTPTP